MNPHDEYPRYIAFNPAQCDRDTWTALHIVMTNPLPGDPESFWVPKSMCGFDVNDESEIKQAGDEGEIYINKWWVERQEWYAKEA